MEKNTHNFGVGGYFRDPPTLQYSPATCKRLVLTPLARRRRRVPVLTRRLAANQKDWRRPRAAPSDVSTSSTHLQRFDLRDGARH